MLQVSFLREEKERVLEGLKKRNFKQLELVDEAIQLDDERKKTQQELDSQLAEINKISKEIGLLMKEGKKEEAEKAKSKTVEFKENSQDLQQKLKAAEARLLEILYLIPNTHYHLKLMILLQRIMTIRYVVCSGQRHTAIQLKI